MADQLATPADLVSFLQQDVDPAPAALLLEAATAVVQGTVGQRLVQVVDDTVTIDLDQCDHGPYLELPERPVTAVTAVLIGSTAVTDYAVQSRGRLWRSYGWRSALTTFPSSPSQVTVTYTHGLTSTDQRLQLARSAVLSLAAAALVNPAGAVREQIDDYAVQYEAAASRMQLPDTFAALLRRRYGRPPRSVQLSHT
jgi:hypothetical protein